MMTRPASIPGNERISSSTTAADSDELLRRIRRCRAQAESNVGALASAEKEGIADRFERAEEHLRADRRAEMASELAQVIAELRRIIWRPGNA